VLLGGKREDVDADGSGGPAFVAVAASAPANRGRQERAGTVATPIRWSHECQTLLAND
jgi:hypothetical protein